MAAIAVSTSVATRAGRAPPRCNRIGVAKAATLGGNIGRRDRAPERRASEAIRLIADRPGTAPCDGAMNRLGQEKRQKDCAFGCIGHGIDKEGSNVERSGDQVASRLPIISCQLPHNRLVHGLASSGWLPTVTGATGSDPRIAYDATEACGARVREGQEVEVNDQASEHPERTEQTSPRHDHSDAPMRRRKQDPNSGIKQRVRVDRRKTPGKQEGATRETDREPSGGGDADWH